MSSDSGGNGALHSYDYRSPSQLREGEVLLVGAGNSGSEIALEVARAGHRTWMSGRNTGHVPFHLDSFLGRVVLARLVLRFLFHRVLTRGRRSAGRCGRRSFTRAGR